MAPWRKQEGFEKIGTIGLKNCVQGFNWTKCSLGLFFLESTNIKEYVFARELETTDRVPASSALPVSGNNHVIAQINLKHKDMNVRSLFHLIAQRVDSVHAMKIKLH